MEEAELAVPMQCREPPPVISLEAKRAYVMNIQLNARRRLAQERSIRGSNVAAGTQGEEEQHIVFWKDAAAEQKKQNEHLRSLEVALRLEETAREIAEAKARLLVQQSRALA
jgi:hypothetical protein